MRYCREGRADLCAYASEEGGPVDKIPVIFALVGVFFGCSPALRHSYFNAGEEDTRSWLWAVLYTKECYTTKHGVVVYGRPGYCPNQKDIEQQTTHLLKRMSAPQSALKGLQVWFIPKRLIDPTTGKDWVYGVALSSNGIVCYLGGDWSVWMDTYVHEATHVLLARAGMNWWALHYAYQPCAKRPAPVDWDACALYPAMRTLSKRKPMLSENNRFRKAFEKM